MWRVRAVLTEERDCCRSRNTLVYDKTVLQTWPEVVEYATNLARRMGLDKLYLPGTPEQFVWGLIKLETGGYFLGFDFAEGMDKPDVSADEKTYPDAPWEVEASLKVEEYLSPSWRNRWVVKVRLEFGCKDEESAKEIADLFLNGLPPAKVLSTFLGITSYPPFVKFEVSAMARNPSLMEELWKKYSFPN